MSWIDVFVNKDINNYDVGNAMRNLFNVSIEQVVVQNEMLRVDLVAPDIIIVCGIFRLFGEYPLHIEIAPLRRELIPTDNYWTIGRLSELLNTNCVVFYHGEGTPFDAVLIKGLNDYQRIKLDPDLIDREDSRQIRITKYLEKIDEN
jgi:hypothetical protein